MNNWNRVWLLVAVLGVLLGAVVIDFPPVARFVGIEKPLTIKKGLDIQGGTQLTYEIDLSKVADSEQAAAATSVADVIRRRVDSLGVTEPVIQKSSNNKLIFIELPGVKDIDQALQMIGGTAELEFREGTLGTSFDEQGTIKSYKYEDWKDIQLTGDKFASAKVDLQGGGSSRGTVGVQEPVIAIKFNPDGAEIFKEVTTRNVGKPIAIFLDKQMLNFPKVETPITDGSGVIQGGFTIESAKMLSSQLSAGALKAPIKLVSQNNVGPTLGKESISKSLLAGLIGLLLVAFFMILFYRLPGVVASLALIYYSLVVLALFIYVPVTLTLSGMAGFILSVGMAVDANILIFARMKEEIAMGKPLLPAIDNGLKRAWSSIRDSNFSSLITAVILFWFGSGLVKGFALTLGLGIIVSMFTAISVSHLLLRGLAQTKLGQNHWLWGVRDNK